MSARTAARSALVLVALALALAVGALLGVAASPAPDAVAVQSAPAVEAPVEVQTVPAPVAEPDLSYGEPFLVALVGAGTELPANADALTIAADLVCEGFTAEVPVVVLADGLVAEFGFTDEEARRFVNLASLTHCHAY